MNRPLCGCGNLAEKKGIGIYGNDVYRSRCTTCRKTGQRYKKDHCEKCGFIAEDLVQLDIDHIDGNPSNNDTLNLQTLCANCHRLKSKVNNDWKK
jgi:hypothetical protein